MNRGFGAPLTAQQGKGLQYVFRKAQQIDQDSLVERLPHAVLVGFVGGPQRLIMELIENLTRMPQLSRCEFSRIKHGESRQP